MIDKDGKVVKTVMRSFSLGEISAVDRPAQAHATVAILKRFALGGGVPYKPIAGGHEGAESFVPLRKMEVSLALTTMTAGHTHLITMGGGEYRRRAGNTDYTDNHSHPWLMDEAGNITVGHALGHNHGIEVVSKGEVSEDVMVRILSTKGAPATSADSNKPAGNTAAEPIGNSEDTMTPEEMKAAEKAAAAQLESLKKRAERAEAVSGLTDTHRAHFRLLKGADADAFLALSESEREEALRKAQAANREVYKSDDGQVFRESDDPRLVAMAKTLDTERKKRKEIEDKAAKAELEKLAGELNHIPGTTEDRVALVKGIQSLPEGERTKAMNALRAQNDRLAPAFKRLGTTSAPSDLDTVDPLDAMAAEIAKRDHITFEKAYTKALDTPQGQKLYQEHVAKRA